MSAEVGLLTHNIKIIGEEYPEQLEQAFGARILVGTYSYDSLIFLGKWILSLVLISQLV